MKKIFTTTLMVLAVGLSANAIRPVHKLFPVKQSDGTTVMLYKNGNGYLAFYTTEDNKVVIPNDNGTLCYAELQNGKLVASAFATHNMGERTEAETEYLSSNVLTPAEAAMADEFKKEEAKEQQGIFKSLTPSTDDGLGSYGVSAGGALPSIGSPKIPVIMVEFSDVKFQDGWTIEKYSRYMNDEGYCEDDSRQCGSVKDYFKANSRGLFNPTFDVIAKVTLSNNVAYYGKNRANGRGQDTNVLQMIKDAVNASINQGVDFSQYEVDGRIPNVIVLYAGYGEATGGDANTIWPHECDLSVTQGIIGKYRFGSYFVGNELNGSSSSARIQVMGMGVMVHELSHALGFPDIYDTSKSTTSTDSPYGSWSVMDYGPYEKDSFVPMGYTAFERSYFGWLTIPEISNAESVTLTDPNLSEGTPAVMFRTPDDTYEYFIIENRQPGTWYSSSYGSGLLLQRVKYNPSAWTTNTLNTSTDYKRLCVITAGGRKIGTDAAQADLYGNSVNKKTSFTLFYGTEYTDMPIYKILKNPDGSITFNVKDASLSTTDVVANMDDAYEKVTDVNSLATNDQIIFVSEDNGVAMANEAQTNARAAVPVKFDGNKVYGNDNVMPFTAIKAANGTGWGFRTSSKTYLSVSASGLKTSSKADANCIATITIADGKTSIVFTGNAAKKNLGYDTDAFNFTSFSTATPNLTIYRKATSADGINTIVTDSATKNARIYNLSGQQVGNDYKGIVIVNGKKYLNK